MSELSLKKPVGAVAAMLCVVLVLSAMAGIGAALMAVKPLWYMLGFEIITLIAGVMGVQAAMGRFAMGPAMALLCVAGAAAIGSLLSEVTSGSVNPLSGPTLPVRRFQVSTFLVAREALAGAIALCGAWVVLSRRSRESIGSLVRAAVFAGLFAAILAGAWVLRNGAAKLGPLVQTMAALIGACLALAMLAGAVHCTIRAFEHGRIRDDQNAGGTRPA